MARAKVRFGLSRTDGIILWISQESLGHLVCPGNSEGKLGESNEANNLWNCKNKVGQWKIIFLIQLSVQLLVSEPANQQEWIYQLQLYR